ncbi:MAG: hypothetical protein IGNPGNKH_00858 [Sodalis sp. Ffu]|nr:MAG: hypothetical protein IGNPGNKH_00858 [Sodalis sp. Ffu]
MTCKGEIVSLRGLYFSIDPLLRHSMVLPCFQVIVDRVFCSVLSLSIYCGVLYLSYAIVKDNVELLSSFVIFFCLYCLQILTVLHHGTAYTNQVQWVVLGAGSCAALVVGG